MPILQPVLTPEQITEITNYVNAYRTTNQAPPLAWDDTIHTASQGWSFNLVSNGIFVHSKNPLYGENLAYFQGYGTDVIYLIKNQSIIGIMKYPCINSIILDFQRQLDILHVWYGWPAPNLR